MAVGCLSAPNRPAFKGLEDFRGPIYHTGEWPHEGVDFTGLARRRHRHRLLGDPVDPDHRAAGLGADRVSAHGDLVGAGLEREADAGIPAGGQGRLSGAAGQGARAADRLLFPVQHQAGAGGRARKSASRQYEEAWERGGLPFLGAYGDLLFEKAANDTIAEFARRKIRSIVKDPATADLLCPGQRVRLQAALRRYRLFRDL